MGFICKNYSQLTGLITTGDGLVWPAGHSLQAQALVRGNFNFLHWTKQSLEPPSDCLLFNYQSVCLRKARPVRTEALSVGFSSASLAPRVAGMIDIGLARGKCSLDVW